MTRVGAFQPAREGRLESLPHTDRLRVTGVGHLLLAKSRNTRITITSIPNSECIAVVARRRAALSTKPAKKSTTTAAMASLIEVSGFTGAFVAQVR